MFDAQYPVDPCLDSEGRLVALVPLLGKDAARPVAMPALTGSWDVDIDARVENTSTYAKLGVSAILSSEASFNHKTAVWDALVGKNAVEENPDPSTVIFQTFWGIGLRVAITYRSSELEGSVNIASIAATAEYRRIDVQYEIKAIGLGAADLASVLSVIPPLGQFDMNAYNLLDDARASLVTSLKERLSQDADAAKGLLPAIISLASVPFSDELTEAAEYRFTMQSITAGLTLTQATARLDGNAWKNVRKDRVQAIYKDVLGDAAKPDDKPDSKAKGKARKWLDTSS